jgi:hypothetical protein
VLSILLDYYFLHVLALLSLRIWDEGDAVPGSGGSGSCSTSFRGPAAAVSASPRIPKR